MTRGRRLRRGAAVLSAGLIGLAVSCGGPHTDAGAPRSMPQGESKPAAGNVYALAGKNDLSPSVAGQRWLVYVPNHTGNTVTVIDPRTYRVIDTYPVGA